MKKGKLYLRYKEFRNTPFPRNSFNAELHEIHAELVDYDGYVAGLVDTYLKDSNKYPKNLEYDQSLEDRVEKLREINDSELNKEIEIYLDYLRKIKAVIEEVKANKP
jgi:hypothetical protein